MSTVAPSQSAKIGRPSDYRPELVAVICARLADGESLRSICRSDDMPDKATVFRWLMQFPDFCDQYTRAKEESAEAHADDMLDIADNSSNDWMETNDPDNPGYRLNGEHVQRARLRIETRKWLASKLKAKKYGDKIESTVNLKADIAVTERPSLTKEEWLIKHGLASD